MNSSRELAGTRTQDPYIKSVLLYQLSYQFFNPFLLWSAKIRQKGIGANFFCKKVKSIFCCKILSTIYLYLISYNKVYKVFTTAYLAV